MNHRLLCFSLFVVGVALLMSSCKHSNSQSKYGNEAVPVSTYTVSKGEAVYYDKYPGTVVALNEVQLRSEVSGFITGIFFKEGQTVHKGQKLYEIDRTKYLSAYNQAVASLNVAKANLDKAQKDADRYTQLDAQNAIAKQKVDDALTNLNNAKMQVDAAEAAVKSAAQELNYATIRAPFDGVIGLSQVKLGALVSAGQTLLNGISSEDPIAVDFAIDEKDISRFVDIQAKENTQDDSIFTILEPNGQLFPATGHITAIDRAVDPQTGTLTVRITLPNKQQKLKSGMSCTVRVKNKNPGGALLIPYEAVTEQLGEYYVFAIEDNKAKQKQVDLGVNIGSQVVVRDGLETGEVIAVKGIQKLRENTSVTVNNSGPQPGEQANSSTTN